MSMRNSVPNIQKKIIKIDQAVSEDYEHCDMRVLYAYQVRNCMKTKANKKNMEMLLLN